VDRRVSCSLGDTRHRLGAERARASYLTSKFFSHYPPLRGARDAARNLRPRKPRCIPPPFRRSRLDLTQDCSGPRVSNHGTIARGTYVAGGCPSWPSHFSSPLREGLNGGDKLAVSAELAANVTVVAGALARAEES